MNDQKLSRAPSRLPLSWLVFLAARHHIYKHLRLASLPICARPLHHQLSIERSIVITEHADLHLVWSGNRLFLKPLPTYLMDYDI